LKKQESPGFSRGEQVTSLLTCIIPGTPQQQGSKTRTPQGSTREANRDLAPWRADAIACLRRAALDQWGHAAESPITDPVRVNVWFIYARPKSHYGTGRNAGIVKASAPYYKASAPDLDKLQRALGDALTQAGILRDDALIVAWNSAKVYGAVPEVRLTVRTPEGEA
jgi:crossover junction endodeoxyribonuclease RusA